MGKITQHIAPKGFRMIRRYCVYSRVNNKLTKDIVHLYNFVKQRNINELLKEKNKQNEIKKSWKERLIESFGNNPFLCDIIFYLKTSHVLIKIALEYFYGMQPEYHHIFF